MINIFISYTRADLEWAEWIAWHLGDAGHVVELQAWHFRDGSPVVGQINAALAKAQLTIAVLSPGYLNSKWCELEWDTALTLEITGKGHRLLPVEVQTGELPPVLVAKARVILSNLSDSDARERLLQAVAGPKGPPQKQPPLPSTTTKPVVAPARPPGMLPDVWNVAQERNRNFIGRGELLTQLHAALTSGGQAALVQALHGLGGIGKTQLAIEYAYRHVGDYDAVWWVRSEESVTRAGDLGAMAAALGLPEGNAQDQRVSVEAVRLWLSQHSGWLLVLDNVPHPSDLDGLLPQKINGHVLITSRDPNWGERATPLKVDVFERPVSVEYLLKRTGPILPPSPPGGEGRGEGQSGNRPPTIDAPHPNPLPKGARGQEEEKEIAAANQLADQLGDLPLALAQAVGYMTETQLSLAKYLDLFNQRRGDLWGREHAPLGRQETVALTFGLNIEQLERAAVPVGWDKLASSAGPPQIGRPADGGPALEASLSHPTHSPVGRAAVELLNVCAFLAPEDIPRSLFLQGGEHLPPNLAAAVNDELAFNDVLGMLRSFSLIELTPESFSLHRLVQAVCRDRLAKQAQPPKKRKGSKPPPVPATHPFAAAAVKLLNDTYPTDLHTNVAIWPLMQRLLPHAQAAAQQAEQLGIEPYSTGRVFDRVGIYLQIRAEYAEAKESFECAVRVYESAFGPEHHDVAIFVNNLGNVLLELGDQSGAKQAFERALKLGEQTFGPDHPHVAIFVNNLGGMLRKLGDLPGAKQAYERALKTHEQTLGPDHPDVATDMNNLGSVFQALGDLSEAKRAFERALKIDEQVFGLNHPNVAANVWNLGTVHQSLGDLSKAKQAYERAWGIYRKFLGDEHPHTRNVKTWVEGVTKLLAGKTPSGG